MLITIKQGMDLLLPGAPRQEVHEAAPAARAAVLGADYPGLRPALLVSPGDRVTAGQPLLTDRTDTAICLTAPTAGRVMEVNRGPKRSIASVVIEAHGSDAIDFARYTAEEIDHLSGDTVAAHLQKAGLWAGLRVRPRYSIPPSNGRPQEIFVNAMDTEPLAPDPAVVIGQCAEAFVDGLRVLNALGAARLFVCCAPHSRIPVPPLAALQQVEFGGPHPAGLPGTHVHHLGAREVALLDRWHIDYQTVIAIGHLFTTGRLPTHRILAVTGEGATRPRLLRVQRGADLAEVLAGEYSEGHRVVNGSVLEGRLTTPATRFASDTHSQLYLSARPDPAPAATGMLCVEAFERVWPFASPVLPLLRALLTGDAQTAALLGAGVLDGRDMALCAYVCPSRLDYAEALKLTQARIRRMTGT
jgi:Na+-transporting NADH:ubiquinone oxidoreductase subunit A